MQIHRQLKPQARNTLSFPSNQPSTWAATLASILARLIFMVGVGQPLSIGQAACNAQPAGLATSFRPKPVRAFLAAILRGMGMLKSRFNLACGILAVAPCWNLDRMPMGRHAPGPVHGLRPGVVGNRRPAQGLGLVDLIRAAVSCS